MPPKDLTITRTAGERKRRQIVLLANKSHHDGPDARLIRLVREFHGFLTKQDVWLTKSTYKSLARAGLQLGKEGERELLSGREGGLVSLTDTVIKTSKAANDRLDDLVYLIDPRDPTSLYPESIALKRECVNHGVMFLSTYMSAVEWFSLLWSQESGEDFAPEQFGRQRSSQSIALIAHDDLKPQMLRFALLNHRDFLNGFEGIVATGVTCEYLKGQDVKPLLEQWETRRKVPGIPDKLKRRTDENISILNEVRKSESILPVKSVEGGPDGGDVEIAQLVLNTRLSRKDFKPREKVDKVVFFEDTQVSRPHEQDIQLLERTCRLCGESIVCHSDPKSAELWTSAWRRLDGKPGYRDYEPVTVLRAMERTFGWPGRQKRQRVVLAQRSDSVKPMKEACKTAAQYIASQIDFLWQQPSRNRAPVRVALGWGLTIQQVVAQLELLVHQKQSAASGYDMPKVIGMALHGLIGIPDPTVEANFLAAKCAEVYDPIAPIVETVPYLLYATLAQARKDRMLEQLRKSDIVVLSCTPMSEIVQQIKRYPVGPALQAVYEDAQKRSAIGEVSGMFVDANGHQVLSEGAVYCGLDLHELVTLSKEEMRRVVLIAGGKADWAAIAATMLMSDLQTTFVTDSGFARGILLNKLKQARSLAPQSQTVSVSDGVTEERP